VRWVVRGVELEVVVVSGGMVILLLPFVNHKPDFVRKSKGAIRLGDGVMSLYLAFSEWMR
jgi:hypothetical protein